MKAAGAAAVVAACGPSGGVAPGQPTTGSSAKSGELRVWTAGSPEVELAMDKLLKTYTDKNPSVTIIKEAFPYAQYFQKILTAAAGGSGVPDVMWMDINTAGFAKRGLLLPLDKYVTKAYLDDTFPAALKEGEWQGARYSVPMHEIAAGIYVNKKLFAEKGISLPRDVKDAWTWAQMREIAEKLTERSGPATTRWGIGFERLIVGWTMLPYIFANGGAPLSPDFKSATGYLNGPAAVEAMSFIQKLHTEQKVASTSLPPESFPTGKVAMFDAVSTYRSALRKFPNFEYDIVPASKQKRQAVMTGGWNVGIYSKTKDPVLAWDLVDYMTREKHDQWVTDSGYLPNLKSVAAAAKYKEHPTALFLDSMDKSGVTRPPIAEYGFANDKWDAAFTDIAGGATVQQALDKAAKEIDDRLKLP